MKENFCILTESHNLFRLGAKQVRTIMWSNDNPVQGSIGFSELNRYLSSYGKYIHKIQDQINTWKYLVTIQITFGRVFHPVGLMRGWMVYGIVELFMQIKTEKKKKCSSIANFLELLCCTYPSKRQAGVPITDLHINPLCAKFLRENITIYLHFMSFLHTNKTQVVEIPPRVRQEPAYST